MKVAVCATVRNERATVASLARQLLTQSRTPDEIVIVDGGSTDGTLAALRECLGSHPHARVLAAPGANIAQGRNRAIAATTSELIAVTDAGIERGTGWLAALLDAVNADPNCAGAFGYILAAPRTTFEAALGAVALPRAEEIDPATYPPSSGSVLLRRTWLEHAGGYPPWLAYGEDLYLDRRIWELGGRFVHAPAADVGIRPRTAVTAFFRQYFNYATGDGHAGMLGRRHIARYAAYGAAAMALQGRSVWRFLLLAGLGGLYLVRPWGRVPAMLRAAPRANALAVYGLVPVLRLVGDLAKMTGYPAGLARRRRRGGGDGGAS
ncbi:MAG: glycosyltransferase [Actinobacteria bacterium]|nr:glycosyltransferase [Actinomycetota bacterium]